MNILHVESSLHWGGQEHRTLAETRWLNSHGHRAWIACNPESELRRRAGEVSLDVPMRTSFNPRASLALQRLCRRLSIDVVHVHSPKDAWICYPLHLAGVPVVRSRQITNPVKTRWSRSIIYRRGCAKIIATADCIRRDLIERNRVAPDRIAVVGEGVDAREFHPAVDGTAFRAEFRVAPDALLFGVVAMIRPEKGHLIFVQAALDMLRTHPGARFAIVGEGTGSRDAERETRKLLCSHFGDERCGPIFMTGFRTDTPAVMAALDALIVPSTAEAQSLVVPQAFATQRAVIASAVGGLPELVRHEDTGLLVTPGSAAALALAMRRIANDSVLRERLAQRGYEHACLHLEFDRKMEQSLAIYSETESPKASGLRTEKTVTQAMTRGIGAFLRSYVLERAVFEGRRGLTASLGRAQAVFGECKMLPQASRGSPSVT
jgi:glycosyltransferase involved in cell wall biosynthesis